MKTCPHCAEQIQDAARVCRWCGNDVTALAGAPIARQSTGPMQVVNVPTNGMAVASLVLGIIWIYWIGSILALIFGHVALTQIDSSGGAQQGRGLAIAGIVLGWVGVGTLILTLIFVGIASTSGGF